MRSQFLDELPPELLANPGQKRQNYPKVSTTNGEQTVNQDWRVGERVLHKSFGLGEITHIFGEGNKVSVAVKFASLGQKIIDPRVAQLQKID